MKPLPSPSQGVSAFYGTHPWHWNLSSGLPTLLAGLAPSLLVELAALFQSPARQPYAARVLGRLLLWTLLMASLAAHKEIRFLFPALQISLVLCGHRLAKWFEGGGRGRG